MNAKYASLFTPWKIGNVEIKNRSVVCPRGGTSLFCGREPRRALAVAERENVSKIETVYGRNT